MQVDTEKFSWFEVPEDIKQLLILAAEHWENTSESENYINQALAKTQESTDVLVAAYRYFFYKNNYHMAWRTAVKVLEKVKISEHLPEDWQQLKQILITRQEEQNIRLYLTAYAASGLVLAKLGDIEKAKEISAKVKEVDKKNEFGGSIVHNILTRPVEEDE
ncbi:MAG: hypothetical protein KME49_07985 [Brasilonema octagenarum HA4186-MV1]|jgi:tetratricopeptide (TPR) repeat protein|uniref:Tetratricopeptide repeat protein n=1 Tax=Brasilonema octagenarum UFV-OR1 TaxID=417115 RepID=A0ABX1M2T0_9CYAN|nr:hypothetical protein [Brasilonema octagenarum]MBW4625430.1 hypothetical protein [Brasilonema octagenarum HA4186-MV1]NMF62795.1 hypothetical protein [Brasilonema octagenarum UFV-OR1]